MRDGFQESLNDAKQIEKVIHGDKYNLVLNIEGLFYQYQDGTDNSELNRVLEKFEHPKFDKCSPGTNMLSINLISDVIKALIESIDNEEQAMIVLDYYNTLSPIVFQNSTTNRRSYEKELSSRKDLTKGRELFLDVARFELYNISSASRKYHVVL